jgi:hypothetical protein
LSGTWRFPIEVVNHYAKIYYGVCIFGQMKNGRTRITVDEQKINKLNEFTLNAECAHDFRALRLGKAVKVNVITYKPTLQYGNLKAQCETIPVKPIVLETSKTVLPPPAKRLRFAPSVFAVTTTKV